MRCNVIVCIGMVIPDQYTPRFLEGGLAYDVLGKRFCYKFALGMFANDPSPTLCIYPNVKTGKRRNGVRKSLVVITGYILCEN